MYNFTSFYAVFHGGRKMEKIITTVFKVESEGYQALTELKNAPITDTFFVSQAVLVKKDNGQLATLDYFDTGFETSDDIAIGGLIGATIGILGGPIGVLLGGSLGAMAGSSFDLGDSIGNASILEHMTELLADGEIALIALADEIEAGAIRYYLTKFDASYTEEDAAEVAAEVQHAAEVQLELERQAIMELRAEKKEEAKLAIADQRAKLKADFADRKAKHAAWKAEKIEELKADALESGFDKSGAVI